MFKKLAFLFTLVCLFVCSPVQAQQGYRRGLPGMGLLAERPPCGSAYDSYFALDTSAVYLCYTGTWTIVVGPGGSIAGSIGLNEVAYGAGVNTIGGSTVFEFNGSTVVLNAPSAASSLPELTVEQTGTVASGEFGFAVVGAEAPTTTAGVSGNFVGVEGEVDAQGSGNYTGIVAGSSAVVEKAGSGTISNAMEFDALTPTQTGGGAITNMYGFYASDLGGIASTLNAAYYAASQTSGANNWGLYDVNGPVFIGGSAPLEFGGSSSGDAVLGVAAAAGTPARINLPTSTGTSGYCLITDGGTPQQTSWSTTCGSGGGGGSPGGSPTQIQYNNSGSFGGISGSAVTSTGDVTLSSSTSSGTLLELDNTSSTGGTFVINSTSPSSPTVEIESAAGQSFDLLQSTGAGVSGPTVFISGGLVDNAGGIGGLLAVAGLVSSMTLTGTNGATDQVIGAVVEAINSTSAGTGTETTGLYVNHSESNVAPVVASGIHITDQDVGTVPGLNVNAGLLIDDQTACGTCSAITTGKGPLNFGDSMFVAVTNEDTVGFQIIVDSNNSDTGNTTGMQAGGEYFGSGDSTGVQLGGNIFGSNETMHNVTNVIGLQVQSVADDGGGTGTNAIGLSIPDIEGGSAENRAITIAPINYSVGGPTNIGLFIDNITGGASNFAIQTGSGVVSIGDNMTATKAINTGTTSNTDLAGVMVASGGTASYTFSETYVNAPVCIVQDDTGITLLLTKTVTNTTLTATTTGATDNVSYICHGTL